MIDIHTHILPGLDDGARDMEDSLSMAALALKSGVHTLVATSHANTGGFFKEYSIEEYLQRLEAFRKALDEVKLPLRVFSGMEIYMTREVPRMIREGRLLSLNQTGYFLTEFSFGIEQEEMDEMLHDLMELGVTPVIAHPERYRCVQESEEVSQSGKQGMSVAGKQREHLWQIWIRSKTMCRSSAGSTYGNLYRK